MGPQLPYQHLQHVLFVEGGGPADETRERHRQHRLDQQQDAGAAAVGYATTKGAIANFTAGQAQLLAEKGIRVNCVAPGPIWTPLIPSTMAPDKVEHFGENTPLKRPGQPAELVPSYVLLASDDGSYISSAMIPVTGGRPMLQPAYSRSRSIATSGGSAGGMG